MKGARSVAAAAALGNLLQGWDNAAVAGKNYSIQDFFSSPLWIDRTHSHSEFSCSRLAMSRSRLLCIDSNVTSSQLGPSFPFLYFRDLEYKKDSLFLVCGGLIPCGQTVGLAVFSRETLDITPFAPVPLHSFTTETAFLHSRENL